MCRLQQIISFMYDPRTYIAYVWPRMNTNSFIVVGAGRRFIFFEVWINEKFAQVDMMQSM